MSNNYTGRICSITLKLGGDNYATNALRAIRFTSFYFNALYLTAMAEVNTERLQCKMSTLGRNDN